MTVSIFAGEGISMRPLTPDDLLIRHNPVDDERWLQDDPHAADSSPKPTVPLERFQTLEHVIRDNPINVDPYLELARIYLHSKRWVDAKRVLDAAFERFEENEEVNYLREEAQLARSLQLLSETKKEYEAEPTQLTEESVKRCHIELNVLREKICRSRLQRHPDQIALNMPLASSLENLGNRDGAIECLKLAVNQPELRAAASLQLGQTYERAQRVPEALSAYRRAALFRVPPASDELKQRALEAAANLAERAGMIDSARRYVELLLELNLEDATLRERLSKLQNTPL